MKRVQNIGGPLNSRSKSAREMRHTILPRVVCRPRFAPAGEHGRNFPSAAEQFVIGNGRAWDRSPGRITLLLGGFPWTGRRKRTAGRKAAIILDWVAQGIFNVPHQIYFANAFPAFLAIGRMIFLTVATESRCDRSAGEIVRVAGLPTVVATSLLAGDAGIWTDFNQVRNWHRRWRAPSERAAA